MRVVFDTNVVVSALVFGGRLAWMRQAWAVRRVTPLVCRPTVKELLRVLRYPKFQLSSAERVSLLTSYLPFAEVFSLPDRLPAPPDGLQDATDAVFLQLALSARADAIVSGDVDILNLGDRIGVPVLLPAALRVRLDSDS